jgi:hypothetical protein
MLIWITFSTLILAGETVENLESALDRFREALNKLKK